MFDKHHVTTAQASEALEDPNRVVIEPDYASLSGQSVRVIGFSSTASTLLTVIIVVHAGREYGASGWESNSKDRDIYNGKGGSNEQDL